MSLPYHWRLLLSLLPTVWLVGGCQIDKLNDPIIIPGIEKELYLNLWENLLPAGNELWFKLETIENEDCLNVGIQSSLIKTNRNIDFDILSIVAPMDCLPGEAPARGEALVGKLDLGTYEINVHLRDEITSRATLEVSAEYFRISANEQNGFLWQHTELRRVPAQTLWGYVSGSDASLLNTANNWRTQLTNIGTPAGLPRGYYGHFAIAPTDEIQVANAPNTPVLLPFLITSDANNESITQLVQSLRQQAPAGLSLAVFSGKGASW